MVKAALKNMDSPRKSAGHLAKRHKKIEMSLDEMLDIIELVESRKLNNDELNHVVRTPAVNRYVNKVISLYKNEDTKPQADAMISRLNKKILFENIKTSDIEAGNTLYAKLMTGTLTPKNNKMVPKG